MSASLPKKPRASPDNRFGLSLRGWVLVGYVAGVSVAAFLIYANYVTFAPLIADGLAHMAGR